MTREIFLQANVFYTLTPRVKNVIRFLSRRSDRRRAHSRRALSRRALSRRALSRRALSRRAPLPTLMCISVVLAG